MCVFLHMIFPFLAAFFSCHNNMANRCRKGLGYFTEKPVYAAILVQGALFVNNEIKKEVSLICVLVNEDDEEVAKIK